MTHFSSSAVTVETLPVVVHQGVRVITTELLAQLYGAETTHIRQNYANNKDRFVAGKHFFKLEGEEIKEFNKLSCVTDSHVMPIRLTQVDTRCSTARSLTLDWRSADSVSILISQSVVDRR